MANITVTLTKRLEALKCKEIEGKKVGNFTTGIREVRLVSWAFSSFLPFHLEIFLI